MPARTLGATATNGAATGAPTTSLTTTVGGSLVWGAGTDGTAATARTPNVGQALANQWLDTSGVDTTWVQRVLAPVPTSGTVVSLGDSAPTADSFNLTAVEIVPATSGLATTYGYDTRGNRTSVTPPGGPAVALGYDQANRLTSYGTTATYAYNGDGLRMSKTVSGTTTSFAWDQSGGLPLLLSDSTSSYIYGAGGLPVEQIDGSGNVTYFHADQLGSTRLLTNSSGGVVATYTYDAYGNTTAKTGTASTPLGYAGQYADLESGLIYLRARYYDPSTQGSSSHATRPWRRLSVHTSTRVTTLSIMATHQDYAMRRRYIAWLASSPGPGTRPPGSPSGSKRARVALSTTSIRTRATEQG